MKPIANPFVGREDYHCFACCPDNPSGLRMRFFQEGDEVVCRWQPRPELEGYSGILHGGVQTTMMDEIASWWIFVNRGTAGATARLEVEFKKPLHTSKGEVSVRASLAGVADNLVTVAVSLSDGAGTLCSEGRVTYFTYPPDLARRRLKYPGRESFVG